MTSNHLSRVLGLCAIGTLAIAGCGDGCGCEPPPTEDAGPGTGRLLIARPLNGATITAVDDEDALTDGIQITVEVRGEDVPEGTRVSLVNSTGGSIAPVAIADGKAVFSGVTLVAGEPPQGLVNELSASAGNHAGDTVAVTVIGESVNLCRFLIPLAGATLSEDANALVAGFQTPVQVACSGTAIPVDAPVTLLVNGGGQRQVALNSGLADFADVTLLEGANTLLAYTQNLAGNRVADVQIAVTVDTGACDAAIAAPAAGTLNAATIDLDPLTPEVLDLDLTVTSSRCLTGTVSVTVNGSAAGTGTLAAGTGQIRVSLPQGSDRVVATVDDDSHEPGASASVTYLVDTLAPAIAVARPTDGAVLGAADDEEVPPNPDNGLTYTVSGTVSNPEGATLTLELTREGVAVAGSPFALSMTPGSGAFARTLANLGGGAYVATLAAVDDAGNSDAATVQFSIDLSVPVVTLAVSSDLDSNDVLNLAEDASSTQEHYQIDVRVDVTGIPDPTLYLADVTLQPVDLSGAPTGQAIVGSQAFAATGQALVRLTLQQGGRYNVTALARHSSGSTSLPTADRIVLVDFVPPGLVINSPVDNTVRASRNLNLLATTPALDFNAASPLLTINGTASSVVPTVSGGSITYAGLTLSGASDESYTIALTIADLAGNPATAMVHVFVDAVGPQVTLSGWASPAAASRLVALSASAAAPTELNTSTQPELDYSATSDGLQFGFKVVVSGETTGALGSSPQARLDIQGLGQPLFAPLVAVGQTFEAVFDAAGSGIGLADGPLSFVATVTDGAGNVGSDTRHALVQTSQYYVRIDSPADGSYLSSAIVNVAATGSVFDGALCDLELDGSVSLTQAISGGALTFAAINLGSEGAHTLQVRCDIGGGDSADSPVHTVTVDVTPPAAPAFAFAVSDTAGHLPTSGFFNLAWASADAVRFVRDVQLVAAATGGACLLADPTLTATPIDPTGTAAHYQAQGQAGARWIVDGSDCVATFAGVDLGLLNDPGQQWTLRADVEDLAGNPAFVETSLWVDRLAPTLVQTLPAAGITQLGNVYDDDPGTVGVQMTGAHRWTFTAGDRALAGDLVLDYTGQETGSVSRPAVVGTIRASTSWSADGDFIVTVTIRDAAGNTTVLGPTTYTVDTDVPTLTLRDRNNVTLAEEDYSRSVFLGGPVPWNAFYDVSAAAGGQFNFSVIVDGVRTGFEVRLCATNPGPSATVDCLPSGGGAGVSVTGKVVAQSFVVPTLPSQGSAVFAAVALEQGLGSVYVESVDEAANPSTTYPVTLNIDTYPPLLQAITVVDNSAANDGPCAPGLCLGLGEQPSDIVVTVSSVGDNEDLSGRVVTLSSSNTDQGAIPTATLVGAAPTFSATFANLALAQGDHLLAAVLMDAIGNPLSISGASNPALFVDTQAPSVVGHSPTQVAQWDSATYDVTVQASDPGNPVEGYSVALTNNTSGATVSSSIALGSSSALFANLALQDNAVNALSARVTDRAGNQSAAYTFSYDVDSSAPAVTLLNPSGDLNLSSVGTCLRTNVFRVSVAGRNRATTRIQLESRAAGTTSAFAPVQDSDRELLADSSDFQFTAPEPCLKPGQREVRARVYETDTGHQSVSASVQITVDLGTPVVSLQALGGDEVVDGFAFLAGMDTNPTPGAYATALTVVSTNAPDEAIVRLYINGTQVGGDQVLGADKSVDFVNVALRDYGATGLMNDLRAEVIDGVNVGDTTAVDCKADGDVPSIAFVNDSARTYLWAHDTNTAWPGVQAAAGDGVAFVSTGVEEEVSVARLLCSGMSPDATTDPVSNAGEFVDMPALLTSTTTYVCQLHVMDAAGNEAVSLESKTLTVDIDRPAQPQVVACIGEDACYGTGCTPTESYEKDDNDSTDSTPFKCYDAATFGGACGNGVDGIDDARCSRRGTFVTLTWVAPGDNGSSGGAVAGYTVSYKPMAIADNPSCSDMSGATAVDTSAMTIVAPGQQQSFTITGLGVHKDYCFEVTAQDAAGNAAKGPLVLRRVPLVVAHVINGGGSPFFGARTNLSGDIDNDGLADLVISNSGYTTDGTTNRGRAVVHFADAGKPDVDITFAPAHGGARFGNTVTTGDFDADGYSDVAIAEMGWGRVYIYFGSGAGLAQHTNLRSPDPLDSLDPDLPSLVPDVIIQTSTTGSLGLANRTLNLNGDMSGGRPLEDLVIHNLANKAEYIFFGRTTWPATLDMVADANTVFSIADSATGSVTALTGGDLDGDGMDDLVIPATNSTAQGFVYVIYGRTSWPASLDYQGAQVFRLNEGTGLFGNNAIVYKGTSGGAANVAVFDWTSAAPRVYFYSGTLNEKLMPPRSATIVVPNSPHLVESLGDVSGDGIADLCVGEPRATASSGDLHFFAGQSGSVSTTASTAYESDPRFGSYLSSGGDYSGDGFDDLAVSNETELEVTVLK